MDKKSDKIIVICGTTASGKTRLGVMLAGLFDGEIVSADSRQVYMGMDIGTGKDLGEYRIKFPISNFQFPMKFQIQNQKLNSLKLKKIDIPYHLIDVVSPKKIFTLAEYQKLAFKAIDDILRRGKVPIVVGGSGLYLQAIVDNYQLPESKPDKKFRKELEQADATTLFRKLKKINPVWADRLNESDIKNKRRLIRYLEVAVNPIQGKKSELNKNNKYDALIIGLTKPKQELSDRIYARLIERLEKEGMVEEVRKLKASGVSCKRLESFGLEYKYLALYLRKKIDYGKMVELLNIAIRQYAKKQLTWLKRWEKQGIRINWIKNESEAVKLSKKFLIKKAG